MTREEAIENIKKALPLSDTLAESFYTLHPELRELEDERIRKELVEAFEALGIDSSWNGIPVKSVIAWLEKQKDIEDRWIEDREQCFWDGVEEGKMLTEKQKENPVDDKSERVINAARRVLNNWLDGTGCPDVSGDFTELEYAIREYDGEEKQKPAEWEDYKDKIDIPYCSSEKEQKPAECELEDAFKNYTDAGITISCDDLVASPKESKPAKWSEKDNIGWDEAFACVTKTERAAKDEEELQNAVTAEKWLKEIKFKYYVHPVKQEWSEEDDQLIGFIFDLLNDLVWQKDWAMSKEECLERLKSLRPQPKWKPSEEQLKALQNAVALTACDKELVKLYNQLKKL